MTKKDFELIAATFREYRADLGAANTVEEYAAHNMANLFADALARTNPRFDRDRFLRACVPGANVGARGGK